MTASDRAGDGGRPRVILVKASINHGLSQAMSDGVAPSQFNRFGVYPPLGLLYIAASVRDLCQLELIDPDVSPTTDAISPRQVASRICDAHPDIVGISAMSFSYLYALELARAIDRYRRRARRNRARPGEPHAGPLVVLGGPHAQLYPEEIMQHACFDVVVLGEGETVMRRIIQSRPVGSARGLTSIPGLMVRREGEVVRTGEPVVEPDLDGLPPPDRSLLEVGDYYQPAMPLPFISAISTRGCPHGCTYCSKTKVSRRLRAHSVAYMLDELVQSRERFGIRSVHYFDDTFNHDRERVIRFCRGLVDGGLGLTFSLRLRADNIDGEMVRHLRRAGCAQVCFGVESGDAEILTRMNKQVTLGQVERAFELCRGGGIQPIAFVMIGHPDEQRRQIDNTIRFVKRLQPDWFKANILTPYPGSVIYSRLVAEGVMEDIWRRITLEGRPYPTPNISRHLGHRQLVQIRDRINLMPYLRWRSNLIKLGKVVRARDVMKPVLLLGHYLKGLTWDRRGGR